MVPSIRQLRLLAYALLTLIFYNNILAAIDLRILQDEIIVVYFEYLANPEQLLWKTDFHRYSNILFYFPLTLSNLFFRDQLSHLSVARFWSLALVIYPLISLLLYSVFVKKSQKPHLMAFGLIGFALSTQLVFLYPSSGVYLNLLIFWPLIGALFVKDQSALARCTIIASLITLNFAHQSSILIFAFLLLLSFLETKRLYKFDITFALLLVLSIGFQVFRIYFGEDGKTAQYYSIFFNSQLYTGIYSYLQITLIATFLTTCFFLLSLIKKNERLQSSGTGAVVVFSLITMYLISSDGIPELAGNAWETKGFAIPIATLIVFFGWVHQKHEIHPTYFIRNLWIISICVLAVLLCREIRLNHFGKEVQQATMELSKRYPGVNIVDQDAYEYLYLKSQGLIRKWSLPFNFYYFENPNTLRMDSIWYASEQGCLRNCDHHDYARYALELLHKAQMAIVASTDESNARLLDLDDVKLSE